VLDLIRRMTSDDALELFRKTGALLSGHFVLRSGDHSREFFQCALALQEMPIVEQFGKALADRVRAWGATTVVAPAMGGLVIGQEIARQLGIRFVFVEKKEDRLVMRRGFKLSQTDRVLIAEDVVTKGGRVQETIEIVNASPARLVGISVLVDRSGGSLPFNHPLESLIQLRVETFPPDQLPPDLQGQPAVKPGS
tara:strand:+ start:821 stop:1405 length:585 start_codon:yes stop_codon:yes gene_type:complete